MSAFAKAVTGIIAAGGIAALFVLMGRDPSATLEFLKGNWQSFILAVQIVCAFILGATKHYIGGAFLAFTSVLTVFGVIL